MNLNNLSIEQLQAIENSLDSYLFKQPDIGEPYHKSYRRNEKSFDLLISQTVKLKRIIRKYFQKQKEKLPQLVHLHRFTADEDDNFINEDVWDDLDIDFGGDISDGIMPIYTNGAKTTADDLGIGTEVDAESAPSQKFLANYSLKLAKDINKTTKADIKEAVQTSLKIGEDRNELTDRLNNILDDEYRSQMIAQTESIRAYTQGRLDVGREIGYDQKQWNTQDGACVYCEALDGQVVGIDEQFDGDIDVVDGPPLHPNCRCYVDLVKSDNVEGREVVIKSVKGKFVTISKGGNTWVVDLPEDGEDKSISKPIEQPQSSKSKTTDFSKPPSAEDRQDPQRQAEHMIKYNGALQAEGSRQFDANVPAGIKEMIYKADPGTSSDPREMAQHILYQLPPEARNNASVQSALKNFGVSAKQVQDYSGTSQPKTEREAIQFSRDSAIKETVYQGTLEEKEHIGGYTLDQNGVLGPAVYFATKPSIASDYGEHITSAKVNVSKIKTFDNHSDVIIEAGQAGLKTEEYANYLARNYDATVIKNAGFVAVYNPVNAMQFVNKK